MTSHSDKKGETSTFQQVTSEPRERSAARALDIESGPHCTAEQSTFLSAAQKFHH